MKKLLFALLSILMLGCSPHDDYYSGRDDYYPPHKPPVNIKTGMDATIVKVNESLKKTSFTYNSWITADRYTQKTELCASIINVDSVISVAGFDFANQTKEVYTKSVSSYYKGELEIVDSVFVYRIIGNNLSFCFEFPFQAATYRGDYGTVKLPYRGFSNLQDKGYALTDMGVSHMNGKFYACKLYQYTISVEFDGQVYAVVYSFILNRLLEGDNPSLSVKVLASGIKDVVDKNNQVHYTSWIKILQTLASGETQEVTYNEPAMLAYVEGHSQENKIFPSKNLVLQSQGFEDASFHQLWVNRDKYIKTSYSEQKYLVKYNYFYTSCLFSYSQSFYDDGINVIEMPSLKYTDIKSSHTFVLKENSANYESYAFRQELTAKLGTLLHTVEDSFNVTVVK